MRFPLVLAAGLLCAVEVAAQGPDIEIDAPEREVAGCWTFLQELPDRRMRTNWTQTQYLVVIPDTIELTLDADHNGVVYNGATWRDSGWRLQVRPDPWTGLDSFASWAMDADSTVTIGWQVGPGVERDLSAGVSQRVVVRHAEEAWEGVATRLRGSVVVDSASVRLEPVSCPSEEYFDLSRWWTHLGH